MKKGIDVSKWQGEIDWKAVKNDDISFVVIKSSEGVGYVDPYFRRNAVGADGVGIDKIGFYHFARPDNNPSSEAEHFTNTIKGLRCDFVALDIEVKDGATKEQITKFSYEWLTKVEKLTGKKAVIYTYLSFAKQYLDKQLTKWPLWFARYEVNQPKPEDTGLWNKCVIWQYSSKGSVKGIKGNVDMNYLMDEGFFAVKKTKFPDVPAGHWAEEQIKWVSDNNLINGYPDGTFGLGKPVTREELAIILYNLRNGVK